MSITIEIPEELAHELSFTAARLGISVSEVAVRMLASARPAAEMPKTGKDLVAYWQREGLIGTRPDIEDSQTHARAIRAQAERRVRA
jgi:hypothetical protein